MWLGWKIGLQDVKWGWRKCPHMTSVVSLECSQVVTICETLTRVVLKPQLGWQAWNPRAIHYSVADQNRKSSGYWVILETSTFWGQQSFDERKKQENLPVVVKWKVRVVHWEETSEEATWWLTRGVWDFWKPHWWIQYWVLHVTCLSACLWMSTQRGKWGGQIQHWKPSNNAQASVSASWL